MNKVKSAFWNIVFGLFFAALVIYGMLWLYVAGLLNRTLPVGDFVLMALAIFRLTRLVCYDVITKFVRDALSYAKEDSFFGTLHALVSCPWCAGLWFSFFVVFAYYLTPLAWPVILILALAGVASFVQILSNFVGWSAEKKKREVVGSDSRTTCG